MKKHLFENFTNLYPLSKTLRFELKPIGDTKRNMEMNQIFDTDEGRSKDYKKVKSLIDEYHRNYSSKQLSDLELIGLVEYNNKFFEKRNDKNDYKELKQMEADLRKQVCTKLSEPSEYEFFAKKEMITKLLPEYLTRENRNDEIDILKSFGSFTTYFSNFFLNRKHMYSHEEKSGTIAYRLINENLPIFLRNIKVYEKFKEVIILNEKEIKTFKALSGNKNLDEVFLINNFNSTLTQVGIERYNLLFGGIKNSDGIQIEGINNLINKYNQEKGKGNQIPKFTILHNQILSIHSTFSFQLEKFENDQEMVDCLVELQNNIQNVYLDDDIDKISATICKMEDYDLESIFINTKELSKLSQKIYSDWGIFKRATELYYDNEHIKPKTKLNDAYYKKRGKALEKVTFYSVAALLEMIEAYELGLKEKFLIYFKEINNNMLFSKRIRDTYSNVKEILMNKYGTGKDLIKDDKKISQIKDYMDVLKEYQEYVKSWVPIDSSLNLDLNFYANIFELYPIIDIIEFTYDKCRNYLTQKPYSLEKIKINFNNATLLAGWDLNKERDNYSILFKKEDQYYLGILNTRKEILFEDMPISNEPMYKKMKYKLLHEPHKMFPKVFFSDKRKDEFNVNEVLYEKYKQGYHKESNENFDLDFCHELIDFYKESLKIHEDWKQFKFNFKNTKEYLNINDFYREVENQGYKIEFQDVPESYIDTLVSENKMYLFKLHNKDFSESSKGKKNLHTLYWNALFSESNLKDVKYKLNGGAEIFYRKASIKNNETIVHEANVEIKNKNPLNSKKESKFAYDLIKDKRFTDDKFYFHVSMTMNFKSQKIANINKEVNRTIKNCNNINVIGIDRGERNLLYVCVVNSKGELIHQESLNSIVNGIYETNYHALLNQKQIERDKARKSWKTIENIKDLKNGYLSQVVHKIATLALEFNAIVVLEDLNFGFIKSRFKFEKQVYQKFEKQLIDKFNYLVLKDKEENELGGILKPLQLTNKFISFKKLEKQSGILYYVPAWKTSKIDPITGFSDEIYLKYENVDKTKEFFNKFSKIIFNEEKNYYEFHIDDYGKFTNKAFGIKKEWVLCSYGERIMMKRSSSSNNRPEYIEVNLTEEFSSFFDKYKVDQQDIKKGIQELTGSEIFMELVKLFKLLMQMRNSNANTGADYLISPVKDEEGNIFDSRLKISGLPYDADANGAYNIARKGIMLINKIKECDVELLDNVKLTLTNQEYLSYLQGEKKR